MHGILPIIIHRFITQYTPHHPPPISALLLC
jgi:hypothetical protein